MAITPIYSLKKPTVGGSQNTWGQDLNDNFDAIDTAIDAAKDAADAAQNQINRQWLDDVATLLADAALTYTSAQPGTVVAGDIVRTREEGFAYEVAASGATDHHVTTACGVKLYVQEGSDGYNLRAFGCALDGATNDSAAFAVAINAALAGGRQVIHPGGDLLLSTAVSFTYAGDLVLKGAGNATIVSGNVAGSVAANFGATIAATTTLAAQAEWGDQQITVASAAGLAVGQLLAFNTATAVETSFNYPKRATRRIAAISGTSVYLSDPLDFHFTVAETTLTAYNSASIKMIGVNIRQATGLDKRVDFTGLQDVLFAQAEIQGYAANLGDPMFLSFCHSVNFEDVRLVNGRYTINVSNGTYDTTWNRGSVQQSRHGIDFNTWAWKGRVRQVNAQTDAGFCQTHPSGDVWFEQCTDVSVGDPTGGIGMRCLGGRVIDCVVNNDSETPVEDAQGVILNADHLYLNQLYDRIYERVKSRTAILSARDTRSLIVRECDVPTITVDGTGSRIVNVDIDDKTVIDSRMTLRRINVVSSWKPQWVSGSALVDSFASVNTIKDITGITQAATAVVTAVAHGFSNGALIRIDGVVGMTQVNERTFTVANVTADTFELVGENSTGHTAYSSGGKAALGRLAKTIDPTLLPGLGRNPNFHFRAVVRKDSAQINPLTAITIPVKVRNVYDISEENYRHGVLSLRAVSSTDGAVVARYNVAFFTGSTSSSSISAAQAEVPALSTLTAVVSNLRHHYFTQVAAEGGSTANDAQIGEFYFSFDVVVTANSTSDRIQYVEVEYEEVGMPTT
jgi:hypothetical protein